MYSPGQALSYFAASFPDLKQSTNGWYTFTCPICGVRDKAAVNFSYGFSRCWRGCFSASVSGMVQSREGVDYKKAIEILEGARDQAVDTSQLKSKFIKRTKEVPLPEGLFPLDVSYEALGDRARKYIESRGLDPDVLAQEGWGYCLTDGPMFCRIFIPITFRWKLKSYVGRTFIDAPGRYRIPTTEEFGVGRGDYYYNQDAFITQPEVYILEGAIDARTLGPRGTAMQGWSMSDSQLETAVDSKAIKVIIPDPDLLDKGKDIALRLYGVTPVKFVDLSPLVKWGKDVNKIYTTVGIDPVMEIIDKTPVNNVEDFI